MQEEVQKEIERRGKGKGIDLEDTNKYTNRYGHTDYILAGVYADEGISGINTKKREQFNKMIEDCKAGKIDIIITKSISRFARNSASRKR